jgi:predicted Mrr-cat superfamily restriction endonuclease
MSYSQKHDRLVIGWANATELMDPSLTKDDFKRVIADHYPGLRPGHGASMMWMFLREMQVGDWVLTPQGKDIYRAVVTSEPQYLEEFVKDDMAFQRSCQWIRKFMPLGRADLPAEVQDAMRQRPTIIDITPLAPLIAHHFS